MTMTLHGLPVSTYCNVVKLALMEKGIEFTEQALHPGEKTEEFLAMSPMGKIPVLEADGMYLTESQAILRFLDAYQPEPCLYPRDAVLAGRAQQIHMFIDLYLQPAAASLVPMLFFGAPVDEEVVNNSLDRMARAVPALAKICCFEPFIGGQELTHADLAAVTQFDLASTVWSLIGKADPIADIPGALAYRAMMKARPSVAEAFAARDAMLAQFETVSLG